MRPTRKPSTRQGVSVRIAIKKRRLANANWGRLKAQEKHDQNNREEQGKHQIEESQESRQRLHKEISEELEPASSPIRRALQSTPQRTPKRRKIEVAQERDQISESEESQDSDQAYEDYGLPEEFGSPPSPIRRALRPESTKNVPEEKQIDVDSNPRILETLTERESRVHTDMVLRQHIVPLRSRARREEERRKLKEAIAIPKMPGPNEHVPFSLSMMVARDERYLRAYNEAAAKFRGDLVSGSDPEGSSEGDSSEEDSEEELPSEGERPVYDAPEFEEMMKGVEPYDLEKCRLDTPVEEIPGYDVEKGGSALDMYIRGYGSEIQKEFDRIVLRPPTVRFPRMPYQYRTDKWGNTMYKRLWNPKDRYPVAYRCYSVTYMFQGMEYLLKEEVKAVIDEINRDEELDPCDISEYYWPPEVPGIPYIKSMVYHWLFLKNVRYVIRNGEIHFIGNTAPLKIPNWLKSFSQDYALLTFHDDRRTYKSAIIMLFKMKYIRLEWIASYLAEIQVKWDFSKEYTCVRKCKKKKGKDGFRMPLGRACYSPSCLVWTYGRKRKIAPLLTEEDKEPIFM
jgi:hypothetical protein